MSLFGRGDFEVNCSSWSMTASSYKEMYFHILYCFQAMSYGKMLLREANQEIKLKAVTDDEYEAIESFCHPAQAVAFCNTVKVLIILINEYPDSPTGLYSGLHFALSDHMNGIDIVEPKIIYLTKTYSFMQREYNREGLNPFLDHMRNGAISVKNYFDKYPYEYALEKKLDAYFIRILLRGDITINPVLLYNLNYRFIKATFVN